MQLSATPLNLQGQPVTMPSGARCTFSSSVQTVMRSSLDGLLFALSAGAATITASCGDKQAAIQAAVAELPPGTPPEAGTPPGSSPVPPAPPTPPAPGQPNPPAPPAPPPPAPPTGDFPPLPAGTVMPEAPRARVDVSYPTPTRTIRVALNGNLQRAIDTARYGDEILLNPAATYIGDFVLPAKAGTGWIVIRSDVPLANFPQGTRITPARAAGFAKLRGVEPSSTIRTAPGARGYRLALLDLAPNANYATATGVVVFDGNQQSATQIPRDLIVDRSWVHGTATQSLQRGVLLNAINAAVVDSYISDVHWRGVEAQAIAGWNGPGPFLVENNYLEASGVNILWGGADPTNPAFAPSDIVVRRNHLIKPLSWKGVWTAKNLFEIKNAARIVVEENLMENCWADAQVGYAVQLIALTDNDNRVTAASTRALDILFRNNVIRNSRGGINVLARVAYGPNPILPSTPLSRLLVANNLFQNVGTEPGIGTLPLMQLLGDLRNTTLAYNTFSTEGRSFLLLEVEDGMPRMQGLTVVGNVGGHGEYGIFSSRGSGQAAFDSYAPGAVVQANVIAGAPAARYPSGNWYPSAMGGIPFTSPGTGNFEIAAPSTWMYQSRIVGVRQADLATAMAANR
ncbi:MAG: hypothetical protein MUF00_15465 [Gemmatimonadaceae bacterium]|nr:hypothetical protein [Gemmatimonadaceae bacterium]